MEGAVGNRLKEKIFVIPSGKELLYLRIMRRMNHSTTIQLNKALFNTDQEDKH